MRMHEQPLPSRDGTAHQAKEAFDRPRLFEIVQIARSLLEILVHFARDSLIRHQFELGGLPLFVEIGNLEQHHFARRTRRLLFAYREEESVAPTLMQDQSQEFEINDVPRFIFKRKRHTFFDGRAEIRSASLTHGIAFLSIQRYIGYHTPTAVPQRYNRETPTAQWNFPCRPKTDRRASKRPVAAQAARAAHVASRAGPHDQSSPIPAAPKEGPPMNMTFVPVATDTEVEQLAHIAKTIWNEYWPSIIGQAQTDYMVEQFQTADAIARDRAEHAYEYWILYEGDRIVGYTGGHEEPETNRFFISKIYLYKEERGKHFASRVIEFYEALCRDRGLSALYLTVNKHNELGIRAYVGRGFETIDAVETDIGNGYVMDDYIMEKRIR